LDKLHFVFMQLSKMDEFMNQLPTSIDLILYPQCLTCKIDWVHWCAICFGLVGNTPLIILSTRAYRRSWEHNMNLWFEGKEYPQICAYQWPNHQRIKPITKLPWQKWSNFRPIGSFL